MPRFPNSLSPFRVWAIAALPLLGMALLVAYVPSSRAAQSLVRPAFVVTSVLDAVDANLGDAVCATADGACTLRAAVQQANALSGPDSISVPPGIYTLTITGTDDLAAAGDLDITDDLTISGALPDTTIIDMGKRDRIFDVYTATVTLASLSLQNGYVPTQGGGIYNRGTLTLTNTRSLLNKADARGGSIYNAVAGNLTITNSSFAGGLDVKFNASSGGAIWNSGMSMVENSTFTANRASGGGGAIANDGTLWMTDSTLRGNSAASGGALYQGTGALTVQRSTVEGNVAGSGGGITVDSDGAVAIAASTFNGNGADQGGGVYNNGTIQLTNSTLSRNQTRLAAASFSPAAGGGIQNRGAMTVLNATLVNNAAATGSALQNSGVITFTNSIVASNDSEIDGTNCGNAAGIIASGGHNIENGTTCGFKQPTDLPNISPALGELRFNAGATKTHALMEGSPALDSGANVGCPSADQRGVTRPQGPRCDIGAFELEQAALPTATPGPVATSVSETPSATVTVTPSASMPTASPVVPPTLVPSPPSAPPSATTMPTGMQRVLLPLVMK